MKFDIESRYDANGKPVYADTVAFDKAVFWFYKSLVHIRKDNEVLSTGNIQFLESQGQAISYMRYDKEHSILVLLNSGKEPFTFHFMLGTYKNLLTKKTTTDSELKVAPLTGAILLKTE
jgi:cyclomaltodextrinase / maltogenic alpha-amylase / neopullulanase